MEHKLEYLKECPICGVDKLIPSHNLKDYFLSRESFIIDKCTSCGFLFTNPRPSKNQIDNYYQSENYISHSNKSKGLFAGLYQIARILNQTSKYSIIKKHTAVGNVLDIGCGTGHFLSYLKSKKWNVLGIEPNASAAEYARNNFGLSVFDENKLKDLENSKFNLITMWHVLEHVHNLNERLNLIHQVLGDDGVFILALPNPDSFDAKYYKNYWAAYDVPRHLYHFTKTDISRLAERHDFYLKKIYPMKLDSFYVSILSENYKRTKLGFLRAFIIATWSNLRSKAKNPNTSSLIYVLAKKGPKFQL